MTSSSTSMKIGVSPYGSDRAAALAFADAAVAAGVHTLWLGDGMFIRPDFPMWRGGLESMTSLAWFAGRHPEVGIGITAAVLPLHDIDWLAREAATLDHLTDGRFTLAVAAGFWDDELEYRGIDPVRRGAELRARLAQIGERWSSGPLSPKPLTVGGPAIWLAGAAHTMTTAIAMHLPFQASRMLPGELAPVAAEFFDRGGTTLAHRIYVEVGDDVADGEQLDRHVLSGSPRRISEGLHAFREMGVSDCSLVLGHDDTSALATLDAIAPVIDELP